MKKYIISLVMAKSVPQQIGTLLLSGDKPQGPDISIQNEVYVITSEDAKQAYNKCASLGQLKHPGHRIVVRVVVEMEEALAEEIN